jgi:diguanylate cyclase (GGDEF)-like protein
MNLRRRILISLGTTLILLVLGIYFISTHLLLRSYQELERQRTAQNVDRAQRAFSQLVGEIHDRTADWAFWDDTYQFMKDRNPEYIKSNLVESTLAEMRLDLLLYIDRKGQNFAHLSTRRLKTIPPPEPQAILSLILPHCRQVTTPDKKTGFQGFFMLHDTPLIVSARPILNSEARGPHQGWLVFGRYFDARELQALAERTCLDVRMERLTDVRLKAEDVQAMGRLSSVQPILVQPRSAAVVNGYTRIADLDNKPALLLKTIEKRDIYRQGQQSVRVLVGFIMLAAAAFIGIVLWVLEYGVLFRLMRLSQQVERIGSEGSGAERITLPGRDEIASLASRINGMLTAIADRNAERQRLKSELEHQAFHDALTDLPNRTLFVDRLALALQKRERQDQAVAVLFFDLDNFKLINDSLGHEAGDRLLITVTQRLQECVRPGDTVARLSGDEFILLLENLTDISQVREIASRIVKSLRAPIRLLNSEVHITGSLGIAYSETEADTPEILMRNADTAMYQAKANGKSGYALFEPGMNARAVARMELEIGLRHALERDEFRVFYQPLFRLETGEMCGVEALARWEHPEHGLIAPGQFVSIAEEIGLIVPIGYQILEQACAQMKQWQEEFPAQPPLTISVNLSGRQLQREDVVSRVADILKRTGLSPDCLKLEITESMLIKDIEKTVKRLEELRKIGVKLAIDDFGTGYSSISRLNSLPMNTLKIDRVFVSRLDEEEEAASIISAILMLSRTMKVDVTAEGIETELQAMRLRDLGCDVGQGYFFSKPLPADAFRAFWQQEARFTPHSREFEDQAFFPLRKAA